MNTIFYTFIILSGLRLTVEGEAKCKWSENRGINELCYDMQVDEFSLQAREEIRIKKYLLAKISI